jgi:S1-C subfamily serine protease
MNINLLIKSVVRIVADNIIIDWYAPYQISASSVGSGTGFFIDNEGHILTCAHVIANANNVLIEIPQHGLKKFQCDVLGICPDIDLALLKIKNYKNKYHLKCGKMNDVNLGDSVIALGFPMNYNNQKFMKSNNIKITKGIISGQQFGIYQTDSPINPGNSGGPLIKDNKVVGINSSIIVQAQNIGYSIPIDYFIDKIDVFKSGKRKLFHLPQRCFNFNQSNEALLKIKESKCKSGVYINDVYDNSNIKKSGMKPDMILCKIAGYDVNNDGLVDLYWFDEKIDINTLILCLKIGQKMDLEYFDGKKRIKKVMVNSPYKFIIREKFPQYEKVDFQIFAGCIFMELTINHLMMGDQFAKYSEFLSLNKNRTKDIIIVSHIYPNNSISKLNSIRATDNIVKINNKKVNTIQGIRKAIMKPLVKNGDKYIKIENSEGNVAYLNLKEVIKEDLEFSKIYHYPLSKLHIKMIKDLDIQ